MSHRAKNPCLEAALRELESAGVRDVEQACGGKRLQLRWRVNGGALRLYTLPATPGDHRASANTRAGVRRMLREDGVLAEPAKRDVAAAARPPSQLELQAQRIAALERHIAELERRLATLESPQPRRRKTNGTAAQLALPNIGE